MSSGAMDVDEVGSGYPADLRELASDVAMVPGVPRCESRLYVLFFGQISRPT